MKTRRRASQQSLEPSRELLKTILFAIGGIVGGVVGLLAVLSTQGKFFPTISVINCQTISGEPCQSNTMVNLENTLKNQTILFSNIPQITQDPLLNTGYLLIRYQRQWPNTLHLTVDRAALAFQIKTSGGQYGVMSDRRLIALDQPQQALYTVHMTESQLPSDFAPTWLYQAITATVETLHPTSLELVSPVELRINLNSGPMDYILNPQEIEENLSRMRAIVASTDSAKISASAGELDVRLRLPVLRK